MLISQRQLFLLGQGEPEKAEVASEYLDILIDKTKEVDILQSYQNFFTLNEFDTFYTRAVREHSNILKIFPKNKKLIGYQYLINKKEWCANDLSNNTKKRHKRSKNQLTKLNAELSWINPEEYSDYWKTMMRFHQQRWEKKNQAGAFSENKFTLFHQLLITSCDPTSLTNPDECIKNRYSYYCC